MLLPMALLFLKNTSAIMTSRKLQWPEEAVAIPRSGFDNHRVGTLPKRKMTQQALSVLVLKGGSVVIATFDRIKCPLDGWIASRVG